MFYPNLKFPAPPKGRPFFYTNFVSTVDGKVAVDDLKYWPIGSKIDLEIFNELRIFADCIIQGGELARKFGEITQESINKKIFQQQRKVLGKSAKLPYYILTKHPQTLSLHLRGGATVFSGSLDKLMKQLQKQGYKHILMEGGPTLFGSFLKEGLIDEIFLTIAPKIYGSMQNSTKNLVEGIMLPPNKIELKLISLKKIKDELFLRYSILA